MAVAGTTGGLRRIRGEASSQGACGQANKTRPESIMRILALQEKSKPA